MNQTRPHNKKTVWIVLGLILILAVMFAQGSGEPEELPDLLDSPTFATTVATDPADVQTTSKTDLSGPDTGGTTLDPGLVAAAPDIDGYYNTPEEVAAYLRHYERLPGHYLTKREAAELGWVSEDGNLWDVTEQGSIGGDRFGNREGLLPDTSGRVWFECDVNYQGGYRGAERLVYSSDGLIYYSDDHYASFTRLEDSQP